MIRVASGAPHVGYLSGSSLFLSDGTVLQDVVDFAATGSFIIVLTGGPTQCTAFQCLRADDFQVASQLSFGSSFDQIEINGTGCFVVFGNGCKPQFGSVNENGEVALTFEDDGASCRFVHDRLFIAKSGTLELWDDVNATTPSTTWTLCEYGVADVVAMSDRGDRLVLLTKDGIVFDVDYTESRFDRIGQLPLPSDVPVHVVCSAGATAVCGTRLVLLQNEQILETIRPVAGLSEGSMVAIDEATNTVVQPFGSPRVACFMALEAPDDSPSSRLTQHPNRFFVTPMLLRRTSWLPVEDDFAAQTTVVNFDATATQVSVQRVDRETQKRDAVAESNAQELLDIQAEVASLREVAKCSSVDRVVAYAARCHKVAAAENNGNTVEDLVRRSKLS